MIEIESGIPIPEARQGGNKWAKTLRAMKTGDSFVVQNTSEKNSVVACAYSARIRVCTRKTEDGQYRIWRIE